MIRRWKLKLAAQAMLGGAAGFASHPDQAFTGAQVARIMREIARRLEAGS